MSVYFYEKGKLNSGFSGWRVSVMVGGKHRQKYLSVSKVDPSDHITLAKLEKEAKELEQRWTMEKNLSKPSNIEKISINNAPGKMRLAVTATPIAGIKLTLAGNKDKRNPRLLVNITHNYKRCTKNICVRNGDFRLHWYKAVRFLAKVKDLSDNDMSKMRAMQPDITQLYRVLIHYARAGETLSLKDMPVVLQQKDNIAVYRKMIEAMYLNYNVVKYLEDDIHEWEKAVAQNNIVFKGEPFPGMRELEDKLERREMKRHERLIEQKAKEKRRKKLKEQEKLLQDSFNGATYA